MKSRELSLHTIQEIGHSEYLDAFIFPDGEQIAVSAYDIKALTIHYDSHFRFSARIALISALISSSVSPSCAAVFCACSISE